MTYTRKSKYLEFKYMIDDVPLERVNFITDLGVTLQSNLTFDLHINRIIKEALRNLGFVIRLGSDFTNINVLLKPFTLHTFALNLNMLL